MRRWCIVALLASCYRAPAPSEACSISCTDACPGGLTCQGGYCVEPGQVCRPSFTSVTAGAGFACGIDESKALWCWGGNEHLQIDPSDRLQFPLATRIEGRTWDAVEAGGGHVCGISEGELYCWGRNDHSQAGPISGDLATPFQIMVPDGPSSWSAVSAGEQATCAIGDGKLYCWGRNQFGALGNGSGSDADVAEPTPVASDLVDWTAVDIGSYHACAVSASSGVFCWGYSANGRVGPNATPGEQLTPALALATASSSVAVSENASCATTADGTLMCWGHNGESELGPNNAAVMESAMPLVATTTVSGWSAVTAAVDKLCGLAGDAVYCWGRANLGGLGNGLWTDQDRFGKVTSGASAVSLGWNRDYDAYGNSRNELELACALVGTEVQCWGDNRYGQLGRGGATMALAPEEVDGDLLWTAVSIGRSHGCGIAGGVLRCWGSTINGQTFGMITGSSMPRTPCMPTLDCDVGSPKPIGFVSNPTDVVTGGAHTCALHNDLITCWGDNGSQQLGTGAAGPFRRDVPQPGGRPWRSLFETGRAGQCASPGGTEVWCWGSAITQHLPMRELSLEGIHAIGVGENMACVLDAMDSLRCAGTNDRGQFGNGAPPPNCGNGVCSNGETAASCPMDCGPGPLTPTQRTYSALSVSGTASFACGVRAGEVECWGENARGQTGAFDTNTNMVIDPTYTPNTVAGLSGCTAVTAGDQHACAICDGRIHCWGDNSAGSLGSGPPTREPAPIPRMIALVLEEDPWVELFSGLRFSCARSGSGRLYCWGSDPHAGLGNGATSANLPVTVLASPIL